LTESVFVTELCSDVGMLSFYELCGLRTTNCCYNC